MMVLLFAWTIDEEESFESLKRIPTLFCFVFGFVIHDVCSFGHYYYYLRFF
jgi:hypothetical protein